MRVVVLEDERPALEQLVDALHAARPDLEVVSTFDSVLDAIDGLRDPPEPDVVFADVRLTDGRSLEVFEALELGCPVIFVTAYDRYTLEAFEAGGIDYLLKPVEPARVAAALERVDRLREHFTTRPAGPRLMVRRGGTVIAIETDEVAWFTTEHRLVFLVTHAGERFVVDRTLASLEDELDPSRFLRTHRSWIVSRQAVRGFRTHTKGRLRLLLAPETAAEPVVSAEHARVFRAWFQ